MLNENKLFQIPGDLVFATIIRRPSKQNKSPYVADINVDGRETLCHVPAQNCAGKCCSGAKALVRVATKANGKPVGANAIGGKFKMLKCEYIMQLIWFNDTWTCAHPTLGEKLAYELIIQNKIPELRPIKSFQKEVSKYYNTDMRIDIVATHDDDSKTMIEVKTPIDADTELDDKMKKITKFDKENTCSIFPLGKRNQIGPNKKKVVSARAIRHIHELSQVAKSKKNDSNAPSAVVLFIVARADVKNFYINHWGCPILAEYVEQAKKDGVTFIARQIGWNDDGSAFDLGNIPILEKINVTIEDLSNRVTILEKQINTLLEKKI